MSILGKGNVIVWLYILAMGMIFFISLYMEDGMLLVESLKSHISSHNRNVMLFRILGFSRGWNWLGEFGGSPRASGHRRRRVLPEVGPLNVVPGAEFGVGSDGGGCRRRRGWTPVGHHGWSRAIWSAAEDAPCSKERGQDSGLDSGECLKIGFM